MSLTRLAFAKGCSLCLLASMLVACGGGGGGGGSSAKASAAPGGNAAPTIQGQPGSSARTGQSYSFQPAANDPDGDALTFSALNLPAWASLNASTGRISGTPASADEATYSGIVLRVSDGTSTASLGPFSITVSSLATGSATVSWTAPTANGDGSVLTNLAGFQILYGRDANDLSQSISLTNPSVSTYLVEDLTPGTWYFAVIAVNAVGMGSSPSNVASKTIS
jgi:hypothetical protein